MFKVEVQTADPKGFRTLSQSFAGTPEAMNCAMSLLSRFGEACSSVVIRNAAGEIVFTHEEILHTFQMVRP